MAQKSAKPLFISWCPKDALDGMQALDPWEELAYRRTLDLLYLHDGKLPDDDERMGWLTKVGVKRWKKIKVALVAMEKLTISDGFLTQRRASRVLAQTHLYIEGQSAKAQAKWAKEKAKKNNGGTDAAAYAGSPSRHIPRQMPDDMPEACPGNAGADANLKPITSLTTSSSVPTTARATPAVGEDRIAPIADEIWRLAGQTTTGDRWHVAGKTDDYRHIRVWIEQGYSEPEILAAAKAVIDGAGEIRSLWGLLAKAMPDQLDGPKRANEAPGSDVWRPRVMLFRKAEDENRKPTWLSSWGPRPDQPGCHAPEAVLREFGYEPEAVRSPPANPEAA